MKISIIALFKRHEAGENGPSKCGVGTMIVGNFEHIVTGHVRGIVIVAIDSTNARYVRKRSL